MSGGRHVKDDEDALWASVVRTVEPLRRAAKVARPKAPPKRSAQLNPSAMDGLPARPLARRESAPVAKSSPQAPLGRKLKKRVARGREAIDARLDLHGLTQSQAHAALLRFLRHAQAQGARIALIVTGKGSFGAAEIERGVLRRQVPMWLELPEFRSIVVGFEEAHVGHGGEGALYVRLRRGG